MVTYSKLLSSIRRCLFPALTARCVLSTLCTVDRATTSGDCPGEQVLLSCWKVWEERGDLALVSCRECQQEVSDVARACPQCGAPFPGRAYWQGTGLDWKSQATLWGYPLVHIAYGRDARGKLRVAKGVVAIGQFAIGLISIAQFGIGLLFGFGQFFVALTAVAQVAVTPICGIGQFATGYVAIGQMAVGYYALGQIAYAVYALGVNHRDAAALEFFARLLPFLRTR